MSWQLSIPQTTMHLCRAFANHLIPCDSLEFCDHPVFLAAAAADPKMMELYARYIEAHNCNADYLVDVVRKNRIAAGAVGAAVAADGRGWAPALMRWACWTDWAHRTTWPTSLIIEFPASNGFTPCHF